MNERGPFGKKKEVRRNESEEVMGNIESEREMREPGAESFAYRTLMREGRENVFHALEQVPPHVVRIADSLHRHGFDAYIVGGSVRNLIMNLPVADWDFTTNASAEQIQEIFDHTVCTNDYGTVQVILDGVAESTRVIEITPYRKEIGYSDSRRPDHVIFGVSLEDDLERRDFTINALAYNPVTGNLVDNHNGIADLHNGIIRAVGDPGERFTEDSLRIMRAVRIAAQMNGDIEEHTFNAIKEHADTLAEISKERIRDEFMKMLMSDDPARGIFVMKETGLLKHVVPELTDCVGVEQNHAHVYDVFEHIVRVLEHAGVKKLSPELRLAALLHDISKPESREWSEENRDWTFYGHEVIGAEVAERILRNLKFPNRIVEKVSLLVRHHMFFDGEEVTAPTVRRMVAKVGADNIWDLIDLRMCDRVGKGTGQEEQSYGLRKYKATVEEVLREPVTPGKMMINGTVLMRELGIRPGKRVGYLIHALLSEVLEDPAMNGESALIARAKELNNLSEDDLEELGERGKIRRTEEERESIEKIRKKHDVR